MSIRPLVKGFRDQLPKGSRSWFNVPESLKKGIKLLFPEVEIIYCHGVYDVYRILNNGVTVGTDILVHEFRLQAPPGDWLLQNMARDDMYRNVPNRGSNPLVDHVLKRADQKDAQREQEFEQALDEAGYGLQDGMKTVLKGKETIIKDF